ncbi:carbohydrate-binding protein [Rufibacter glacialis]|nr:carbohydrate-binding protein [Rufibacter glacialis]GGK56547.1 hypothetical protein GCM10011405_00850 [Rufibacter glacialis]
MAFATHQPLPGLIQAESYDAMSGMQKENTNDTGGGQQLGNVKHNGWADYKVNVAFAGKYTFSFRVSSPSGSGSIEIRSASGTTLAALPVPATGGWNSYATVRTTANLTAGEQTLRIFAPKSGWNLNWFEATATAPVTLPQASITFGALPGKTVGDAPFDLTASSTNTGTPVTFASSNPAVVAVSNATGKWVATVAGPGSATITASQAAGSGFTAANSVSQSLTVAAAPAPAPITPPKPIPGLIQAEAYDAMSGVQRETTGDMGGGQNLSYIDNGDWMDYRVNVTSAGAYSLALRVASPGGGSVEVRSSSGAVLTTVSVPMTGGWHIYTTVQTTVSLPAGEQTLRFFATRGGWNFNWFEASAATASLPQAVITFGGLPGKTVGDAAFDLVASSTNAATAITFASSNPAVVSVSNATGKWLATVHAAGTAVITASQAAGTGFTAANNVSQTQSVAAAPAPALVPSLITFAALPGKTVGDAAFDLVASSNNTASPITFTSSNPSVVSVSNATGKWRATVLAAGTATITASQAASAGYTAANSVSQVQTVAGAPTPMPSPTPSASKPIPGLIQAESYDAFSGTIQKETTGDTGGGENLGYISDNNWLDYKVNVTAAGTYSLGFRVASPSSTGFIEVRAANGTVLGSTDVPNTGGWQTYATTEAVVNLLAGEQTLRLQIVKGGFNLNWIETAKSLPQAVITFHSLGGKVLGDAPFELVASSTNTSTPIIFSSSNTSVVSVSNSTGKWLAKVVGTGTTSITASQAGSSTYKAATSVARSLSVTSTNAGGLASNDDEDPALKKGNEANRVTGIVPIEKYDVYNLNNTRYLDALVDKNTDWVEYGHGMLLEVAETYFDVRDYHVKLSQLQIFNNSFGDYGTADAEWYYVPKGKFPKDRVLLGKHRGKPYLQYSNFPTTPLDEPVEISWIIRKGPTYMPREVSIVGSYIPKPAKVFESVPKKPFKNHLGNNSFVWDFTDPNSQSTVVPSKLEAAKPFIGGFRFYMDATTFEASREVYTFNPTSAGWWNYDILFSTLKDHNLPVLACIRGQSGPMLQSYPSGERDMEKVPVYYGANFEDPASYKENAQLGFQTAARYGTGRNADGSSRTEYLLTKAKVQSSRYTSSNGETSSSINNLKVGLGTLTYIQHDNERDKWWKGRQGYQTGREYAANMSAFYDGHKGALGPGVGVKDADPNMKVVTTGIALANTYYFQGMLDWCREFRGYKKDSNGNLLLDKNGAAIVDFPADIIAFHNYLNNGGQQHSGSRGVAPELGGIEEIAGRFVKFAKEKLPGVEVWQTETGYDTRSTSSQAAIAIGSKSQDITQADWNLRIALLNWKVGVDRTMYYMLYDTPLNTSWDLYTRSGFINNDQTRRPAADFFKQAGDLMGSYIYNRTLSTDPYILEGTNGSDKVYACWIPDEKGRTATYTLDLGSAAYAYIYTPRAGSDQMTMQRVPTSGGKVNISVTETPIFVKTSASVSATSSSMAKVDTGLGTVNLYPNPTSESINIDLQSEDVTNKVEVKITSMTSGKLYQTLEFEKTTPAFHQNLNLKALPVGGYVIEITQGSRKDVKKFFKVQ